MPTINRSFNLFSASAACTVALALPGVASAQSVDATLPSTTSAPKVYVFPLIGQMGTDISETSFEVITKDLDKSKPDIIVFQLKSADIDRNDYLKNDNPAEFGLPGEVGTYRQMLKDVRDKYRDIPQVVWVQDAVGISSLFALGWPRMYMISDARLFGLYRFKQMVESQWEDPDVRSKMVAAWTGIMKGLVEVGGYPREVADALIFPENRLSVSFEGRGAKWASDTSGVWVVDSSEEAPCGFNAQLSEDTMLSDGTADSFDDLMYLLGYREFQKIDSGEKIGEQFVKEWRKAMDECFKNLEDAQETEDSVVGLGKRKNLYEKTIALMKRYPMIEKRMEMQQRGVSIIALEGAVDDIKKEIQRQREAEKQGRQGGGGG
ncbi:MAG: hypothetical protein ACKO3W_05300, partial [bacterium]